MNFKNTFLLVIAFAVVLFSSCGDDGGSSAPAATGIVLDQVTLEVEKEASATLIATLEPEGAEGEITWSSSDPSVVAVVDGVLTALKTGTAKIAATHGAFSTTCDVTVTPKQYTSARIITKDKQDFKYGKIEARLQVPKGRGTWPAFWMLGYGRWPQAGEIDMMEYVGYDPNTFHCALHTANKNGMNGRNQKGHMAFDEDVANDFHTITMEWVENEFMGFDRIHIYIDGVKSHTFAETAQLRDSGDWPFNDNFFFILNLAIGGSWGGALGVDDAMFDSPVLFKVDYVRVYQLQ